ncbi:uncharacterized protein LOC144440478 [Glandiceps talaboti]
MSDRGIIGVVVIELILTISSSNIDAKRTLVINCKYEPPSEHYNQVIFEWRKDVTDLSLVKGEAKSTLSDGNIDLNNIVLTGYANERFDISSDGDLKINQINAEDEGLYECIVNFKLTNEYKTRKHVVQLVLDGIDCDPQRDMESTTMKHPNWKTSRQTISSTSSSTQNFNNKSPKHLNTENDEDPKFEQTYDDDEKASDGIDITSLTFWGMVTSVAIAVFIVVCLLCYVIRQKIKKKKRPSQLSDERKMLRNPSSTSTPPESVRIFGNESRTSSRSDDLDDVFVNIERGDQPQHTPSRGRSIGDVSPFWAVSFKERSLPVVTTSSRTNARLQQTHGELSNNNNNGPWVQQHTQRLQDWIMLSQLSLNSQISSNSSTFTGGSSDSQQPSESYIRHDRFEIPRGNITLGEQIGKGHFGEVFKGKVILPDKNRDGTSSIAVKTLKESAGSNEKMDLLRELEVMKMIKRHPFVINLLGCCTTSDVAAPVLIILEYATNGNLRDYLRKFRRLADHGIGKTISLTLNDLTRFSWQIAEGMSFLHESKCIHRDLAARNILVDANKVIRIADFGLAKFVGEDEIYEKKTSGPSPVRWMAPESLRNNIFTFHSDVWAYGVLLYEIFTLGSTPYPQLTDMYEVRRKVQEGYTMPKPTHCRLDIYQVMEKCWHKIPSLRQPFSGLAEQIKSINVKPQEYIKISQLDNVNYINLDSKANTMEKL